MKDLKWPAVVVIIALLVVLGWLSNAGKDATTVLAGVIAVLSALGFGYQFNKQSEIAQKQTEIAQTADTIRDQTNGRITQMITMLEQQNRDHRRDMNAMADKLAMMTPPENPASVSGAGVYADRDHGHPANV